MQTIGELFYRYIAAYESGEAEEVAAFLHSAHTYHPPGGAKSMNRAERVADERFFFAAFSVIETFVEDMVVEDNKVAARITMRCTQTGEYQGLPASGRRIEITYMEIVQFQEEMILEDWAEFDMMSILGQLRG